MPHSITPLDIRSFASPKAFQQGEILYQNRAVKNRFQTHVGLKGVVFGEKKVHTEVVVDQGQLFGRCSCRVGSGACEHQVALLLAWVNEPESFINIESLRKAVRAKDKETLADVLLLLCEMFPELCSLFGSRSDAEQTAALKQEIDDIFDVPQSIKLDPRDLILPLQILTIRAKLLRSEGNYRQARMIYFHLLRNLFSLVRDRRLSEAFTDEMMIDLADGYEELCLADPRFDQQVPAVRQELELLDACRPETDEFLLFEELKNKIGLKT